MSMIKRGSLTLAQLITTQNHNLRQSWRQAVVALVVFAVCIQQFWSVQSSPVHSPGFTETLTKLCHWKHYTLAELDRQSWRAVSLLVGSPPDY